MGSLFYFLVLWLVPLTGPSVQFESVQPMFSPTDHPVTMLFGGDLNLAYRFEQYVDSNFRYTFAKWSSIGSYDFMMVNLENPITFSTDSVEKKFVFRMKPDYLLMLKTVGVKLVNCANNHVGDFGRAGIVETLDWLDSAGIQHVGAGKNIFEARRPVIVSLYGKKIGFLGYGSNGIHFAGMNAAGTVPYNETIIANDVRSLHRLVDFIVVNIHWGDENATVPNEAQVELGHKIIEAGADLIVGHHPHVLQGIEKYKSGVIAYSLGNFLFGGNSHGANDETIVLKVIVRSNSWNFAIMPVMVSEWQPQYADRAASNRVMKLMSARSSVLIQQLALH